eukprot:9491274-Pyramimonas_sp.AAC.1
MCAVCRRLMGPDPHGHACLTTYTRRPPPHPLQRTVARAPGLQVDGIKPYVRVRRASIGNQQPGRARQRGGANNTLHPGGHWLG